MLIIHSSSSPAIYCLAESTPVFLLINSSAAQKCHICLFLLLSSKQLPVLILYASVLKIKNQNQTNKKKKSQPKEKSSSVTKYITTVPRTYFNIVSMCLLYSTQMVQCSHCLSFPSSIFPLLCLGDITCGLQFKALEN